MIRLLRFIYVVLLLSSVVSRCLAQVQTGTPPFGTFGGGPDVIDLGNLNVHVPVPMVHRAGRGTDFTYDLSYDNSIWYPVTSGSTKSWVNVPNWGWRAVTEVALGYISYTQTGPVSTCSGQGQKMTYSNWTYHDTVGVAHWFGAGAVSTVTMGSAACQSMTGFTLVVDGYTLTVNGLTVNSLVSARGAQIQAPVSTGTGAGSYTDSNGNILTANTSGQFYDTLSSTTPVLTATGSGTPASPLTLTYAAPGGSAAYKVLYVAKTVQTHFLCSGIPDIGATAYNLVSEIDLQDGSKYTFLYEPTTVGSSNVTGRLGSVTLPTGGTITYSYTGANGGINCADGSTLGFTRATPDGTWTYTRTIGAGNLSTTTVTDPQNNQTLYSFSGIYELEHQVYQGSTSGTLLQTHVICYNGNFSNCSGSTITPPITSRWDYRYFPNLANPAISATFYNSYELLTEDREFDYVPTSNGVPFLTDTGIVYATLGNGIVSMPQTITTTDNAGNVLSKVANTYDQGTPTASSGTPQHVAVTGSRGNLTTTASTVQGTTTLNKTFTYFDTGNVQTATDVNGAVTTYSYAGTSCGNAFPTSVSEPLSLSRSIAWNCTGGVQTSVTDENNQVTSTVYNDPDFWRPHSTTDATGAVTTITYNGQNSVESVLPFNSNASATDVLTTLDGLGRVHLQQTRQAPGSSNFDSVETDYDSLGRPSRVTLPYVGTAAQTNGSAPATTTTYDALSRPLQVSDAGGGSTTYSYPQNDVLVTVGPAPSGENTKRRQLEYDGLARLTSVCEITGLSGSGTCSQNSPPGAGYWTKYVYGPANLLTVTQNAQASSGSQQTRSYSYDGIGRLTSETNPESGTTTYSYDVVPSFCYGSGTASAGDLTGRQDPAADNDCFLYDALHRVWSVGSRTGCKRFGYDNGNVIGSRPSGVTVTNGLGRMVEAETDNCGAWPPTPITDEWFSYTSRGELTNFWELTPHSGAYYNSAVSYWANGTLNVLTASGGYSMIYSVDGEGRTYSAGGPLTSTVYNAASQPTQLNFPSGDSDQFTFDPNTYRMTQYKYNVNGQSVTGNLTWNANGTLGTLGITDPFNSANAQSCSYSHDDLVRIASVNCGAATWQQNFTYDPFGNITKTVPTGGTGNSFQPTYSTSTNHITNISGFTPTYDANGDVTNDSNHTYTWDGYGNPTTIDGIGITYDALDRMVEQNRAGNYTEINYSPTGFKMVLMNGATAKTDFVPLPGGAMAVYSVTAPDNYWYRHADWLGNSRLATNPNRTVFYDGAYAPFGEPYAPSGTTDLSFTGMNQDTSAGLYDFLYREFSTQGRWSEPDPGGLSAVDPSIPQTWNRYAYVENSPLSLVDPFGYLPCDLGANGIFTTQGNTIQVTVYDSCTTFQPWLTMTPFFCYLSNSCGQSSSGGSSGGGSGNSGSYAGGARSPNLVVAANGCSQQVKNNPGLFISSFSLLHAFSLNFIISTGVSEGTKVATGLGAYKAGVAMTNSESTFLQILGTTTVGLAKIAGYSAAVASGAATTVATASDLGARGACALYEPIQIANNPFVLAQ